MERLAPYGNATPVALFNAQTTLPFPPLRGVPVPDGWANAGAGVVPAFDLRVWAADAVNLSVAEVLAGTLRANAIDETAIDSVTNATNLITEASHGLETGDGPVQLTTSDTLPAGLALATDYWIVKVDANTFRLAASFADALAGTAVEFTDDGTGTHTYTGASAQMISWHSKGFLGTAESGDVVLTARKAYAARVKHDTHTVAYALTATLSGAVATSAEMVPVEGA